MIPDGGVIFRGEEQRPCRWDFGSMFCVRCGAGRYDVEDGLTTCPADAGNVVAISHRVRGKVLAEAVHGVLGKPRG